MGLRQESCIPSPLQSGFYCQDIRFQHQLVLILCLLPVLVVGWNCWTLVRARNSHWPWGRRCSHTLTPKVCSMPSDVTDLTDWKQWVCSHFSFWVCAFVQLRGCQRLTSGALDCSPSLGSWLLASTLLRQHFLFFIRLQIPGERLWGHLGDSPVLSDVHIWLMCCREQTSIVKFAWLALCPAEPASLLYFIGRISPAG